MHAFTLIELLVVVTIIIVLVAVLMPSLNQAVKQSQRVACMGNLRGINTAFSGYAADCFGMYPAIQDTSVAGNNQADAYDLRLTGGNYSGPSTRPPLGFGLLVSTGQLPISGLGKVIHCPSFNSLDNANFPGSCMDLPQKDSSGTTGTYGGSYWNAMPGWRIIGSYNYRGLSYFLQNNGSPLTTRQAKAGFVMAVDTPDVRFRGWQSQFNNHGGYCRVFGDGSASIMIDPKYEVETIIAAETLRQTVEGRGGGGGAGNGSLDEAIYALMAWHN